MELYCTYIETKKFDKVVSFYEKVMQVNPNIYTEDRWVEFDIGNKLAIYNRKYDEEKINKNDNVNFNEEYIKNLNNQQKSKMNNIITLNFYTEKLKDEYDRIKELHVGNISEIMYVNIKEPYYYFTIQDPEGNLLEIFSNSYEKEE